MEHMEINTPKTYKMSRLDRRPLFKTLLMFEYDIFPSSKHDPKERREHEPLSLVSPSLDSSRNKGQGSPFTLKQLYDVS